MQSSGVKWYTKTMETLKEMWQLPSGKMLIICVGLILADMVGEQVWWSNFAPKGSVRCDHTTTGIVCVTKK